MSEIDFITRLRGIASDPAARGLADDAAVWEGLVLTHDMIVEGVHFLSDDAPHDVAWKLLAVNLSDLAAKGAVPVGVLMGYALTGDEAWDAGFVEGLSVALRHFDVALLGGDTVRMPAGAPRCFGLTAIGRAPEGGAPSRSGARVGDALWVTGSIGDAGLGLAARLGKGAAEASHLDAYVRPQPQLAFGQQVAGHVHAMMDVSDGLLIDAQRLGAASGCKIALAMEAVPLSPATLSVAGDSLATRVAAATAGDDYQLLFAAAEEADDDIRSVAAACGVRVTRIGAIGAGAGIILTFEGAPVDLPARMGFVH